MSAFDTVLMVDWSGGNDRGPTPKKDAIWIGGSDMAPLYQRNRHHAETWLRARIDRALQQGERVLLGFDFPFGYPKGFAQALTKTSDPFAVWDWLERRIEDLPEGNNRWEIAAELNRLFPGVGPFWGNGGKTDWADLPRKGRDRTSDTLPERRSVELAAPRAFPVWQLAGAGSVGSQVLMGLPVLARLRRDFGAAISVWPFQPPDGQVVLAEIWPSILNDLVHAHMHPGAIRDAVQVDLIAAAFAGVSADALAEMLSHADDEEGWILGLGHEDLLIEALTKPKPPVLANDCFALPPGVDWTPVAEAMARLRTAIAPVVAPVATPLDVAAGRILAADVVATRANPPAANAAVDGYGFAQTSDAAEITLPLVAGRAAAGQAFDGAVPAGHAVRILTGAALPQGVDTVVLEEDCAVTPLAVSFRGPIKRGSNTRAAGEDFAIGHTVLPRGAVLRSPDIALAAAAGAGTVTAFAPLRVGVLSTGDELVEATAQDRGVVDANRPMLSALVARWGYTLVDLGIAPDDPDAVRAALDRGADTADVILTSGGASAGDEDHISALLRTEGHLTAWRIALKPGRPLAMAMWRGTPVFGLPGNPVAAFVCTLLFARPALSVLAGGAWLEPLRLELPAAFAKRKKAGRSEYPRARQTADGRAEVFTSEGSGRISGLSWANGLLELGPEAREIRQGDLVTFLPFAGFGL
ncbi:MAG: molybdopterin-binding protein [Pseudomonadota bacterium]